MFPKYETIETFMEISKRDGMAETVMNVLSDKNPDYEPLLTYLKKIINKINADPEDNRIDSNAFSVGYLVCFNLFRIQIESEDLDVADLESNIESLRNYIAFLEDENSKLKAKNDSKQNTNMH